MVKLLSDRVTEHFRLSEFANHKDGGVMVVTPQVIEFIQMLERFRLWYGRPVNITSGYRTPSFNRQVGGASNSYHLKGLAIDFRLPMAEFNGYSRARQDEYLNNVKNKWYSICGEHGKSGSIIFYDTYLHMSLWPTWYFDDKRGNR
jgi:hypothetical protein